MAVTGRASEARGAAAVGSIAARNAATIIGVRRGFGDATAVYRAAVRRPGSRSARSRSARFPASAKNAS